MVHPLLVVAALSVTQPAPADDKGSPGSPNGTVEITVPVTLTPPVPQAAPKPSAPAPDRWLLMRQLQGTGPGALLDDNRLALSGWVQSSFTASTAAVTNEPMVWNDRANEFLVQQAWVRFARTLITTGTTEPTAGFQIDVLAGSDYRFTLPWGFFNSQLVNSTGAQNLYGVDLPQHYASLYVPTLFRGTEIRLGRFYTPWGVESIEGISAPLLSRSYTFNSTPFTTCGLAAYVTFTPEWSGVLMLTNGNDVYFGDPSEEVRFMGNVKWTQPGGRNTLTVAVSAGRGKFNAGAPFAPATLGLSNEPLGRNNVNVLDVVWTHTFSPVLGYNLEASYGYQTNVPGLPTPTGFGNASWVSAAHYLFYTLSPRATAVVRLEHFDDFQGQRTGFEGLYTELTAALPVKVRKGLIIRPELRVDYNHDSAAFSGRHALFTAAADVILRW